jgi:molecular chaperone DnaJ
MKDYYAILAVTPAAEDVVIRAAYKALVQRYHPDRHPGDQTEANAKMAEINEAFSVLSDPMKRKQYDIDHFVL